jgi:hypothetical protein
MWMGQGLFMYCKQWSVVSGQSLVVSNKLIAILLKQKSLTWNSRWGFLMGGSCQSSVIICQLSVVSY